MLINRSGIEWVDKCKMGIYYGQEKLVRVYSSFDLPVVMLCRRMCGALTVLLADKVQSKNWLRAGLETGKFYKGRKCKTISDMKSIT